MINVLWITTAVIWFLFIVYKGYIAIDYNGKPNYKGFHIHVPDWLHNEFGDNEANCRYCNVKLKRIKLLGIWIKKKDK